MSRASKSFIGALTNHHIKALGLDNRTLRMTGAQRRDSDRILREMMRGSVRYGTPIERGTK